jgi:hypothetical protein
LNKKKTGAKVYKTQIKQGDNKMQNFRKLPAMKRKIAGASNKLGKMNEMIEKIKNDSEIDENIKKLMEQNLRYYVQKEYGIDAGFKK